jgi:hypothetical protein
LGRETYRRFDFLNADVVMKETRDSKRQIVKKLKESTVFAAPFTKQLMNRETTNNNNDVNLSLASTE